MKGQESGLTHGGEVSPPSGAPGVREGLLAPVVRRRRLLPVPGRCDARRPVQRRRPPTLLRLLRLRAPRRLEGPRHDVLLPSRPVDVTARPVPLPAVDVESVRDACRVTPLLVPPVLLGSGG